MMAAALMAETGGKSVAVQTAGGVLSAEARAHGLVAVDMGEARTDWRDIPLSGEADTIALPIDEGPLSNPVAVSMGNPHCVVFVDDPEQFPVESLGPALENHEVFPERTNVEFVAVRSRQELEQRTWERGSGETLACGSGACAAAVAAVLSGRSERELCVRMRGGVLRIRWPRNDGPVWLTGPAVHVFDGELEIP